MTVIKQSLADQVAAQIVERIVAEGLTEGDALPSTSNLAAAFGVSLPVVREAQALLIGQGLLASAQGKESVVLTPGAPQLEKILSYRLRRNDFSLSQLIDVRVALETVTAAGAATNRTDDDIAAISRHLVPLEDAASLTDYHQHDIRFHHEIALASGNQIIVMILDSLTELLMDFRTKATDLRRKRGEHRDLATEEHRAVLDAIVAGDPDAAAAAMRGHLESSRREIA